MSYARFSDDSSVYVFLSTQGHLECCGCSLRREDGYGFLADSTQAMLDHLGDHLSAGHKVPFSAFERLRERRKVNDAYIRGHKDAREGFAFSSHAPSAHDGKTETISHESTGDAE